MLKEVLKKKWTACAAYLQCDETLLEPAVGFESSSNENDSMHDVPDVLDH